MTREETIAELYTVRDAGPYKVDTWDYFDVVHIQWAVLPLVRRFLALGCPEKPKG